MFFSYGTKKQRMQHLFSKNRKNYWQIIQEKNDGGVSVGKSGTWMWNENCLKRPFGNAEG